ncbi:MAG: D-alanine--D-alanine ligase [Oscillibacter sp.]|nr:D-alanine--D-alanine ligase [Oscillibacter sp.]
MKIVVLAGGLSSERTVSLVTSRSVCAALRENGHQAVFVDLYFGLPDAPEPLGGVFDAPDGLCPPVEIAEQAPDLEAVRKSRAGDSQSLFGPNVLELCRLSDIVFLGLHGRDGEDGRVQATLDLFGVPYTGSGYLASALAMDKAMCKRMMESAGIPTPKWRPLSYTEADIDRLAETLPMPCVIKCTTGGSSLGVFLPDDRAALRDALRNVSAYGGGVIMEERIFGRELTVGVLGDRALPAVEILPDKGEFNYRAKYQTGGARELCPAPITPEQQREAGRLALLLHRTLGLQVYSRTDFLLDEQGRFWCLEVNSLPGLTGASLVPKEAAAIGMTYPQLCEEIVKQSLRLNRRG